jgi:hypothetical protein
VIYTIIIDNEYLGDTLNQVEYKSKVEDLKQIFNVHFRFERSHYCDKQQNTYDCGPYSVFRLFCMKYSKDKQEMTYVNNRTKITNMRFFRLYILSELIQYSNCHKVIHGGASLYNESDDDYSVVKSIVSVDDNDDDTTV